MFDGLEEDASRMSGLVAFVVTAWAIGGLLLGAAYFAALWRTTAWVSAGGGRMMSAALTLGRFAAAALVFAAAARCGTLPLLSAFLGFLFARSVALRAAQRLA